MVVTGIFQLEEEELAVQLARADSEEWSECQPGTEQPSRDDVYEEKIAEYETLVSMRAINLRQAMLLSDLLSAAGVRDVEIDAQAA